MRTILRRCPVPPISSAAQGVICCRSDGNVGQYSVQYSKKKKVPAYKQDRQTCLMPDIPHTYTLLTCCRCCLNMTSIGPQQGSAGRERKESSRQLKMAVPVAGSWFIRLNWPGGWFDTCPRPPKFSASPPIWSAVPTLFHLFSSTEQSRSSMSHTKSPGMRNNGAVPSITGSMFCTTILSVSFLFFPSRSYFLTPR